MVDLNDLVGVQVDNVDFAFGDVEDDDFFLVDHAEEVDNILIGVLKEDLAIFIEMDYAFLLTLFVHPDHYKSVVVGGRGAENLGHGGVQIDVDYFLEDSFLKHVKISIILIFLSLQQSTIFYNLQIGIVTLNRNHL